MAAPPVDLFERPHLLQGPPRVSTARNTGRCSALVRRARWRCTATNMTPTTPTTAISTTTTTDTRTTMLDDFLLRAGLAAVGLSLATGPLGSFVVWRRMAYFGDATAHAAILGVALALATDLPIGLGTLVVALAMAVTVAGLSARGWAMDTTLGVLAHSALASVWGGGGFGPDRSVPGGPFLLSSATSAVSRTDWR